MKQKWVWWLNFYWPLFLAANPIFDGTQGSSAISFQHFSSSCGGLQPWASTMGPYGPIKKIIWEIFFRNFSLGILFFFKYFLGEFFWGNFFQEIFSRIFVCGNFDSWQLAVGRWRLAGGSWQVVVSRWKVAWDLTVWGLWERLVLGVSTSHWDHKCLPTLNTAGRGLVTIAVSSTLL